MRAQTFLDIILADEDAVDIEIEESSGHRLAKLTTDSNMFPFIQPDTYQSFTGDHYVQMELEYVEETLDRDITWDDHDPVYNNEGILRGISQDICNALPVDDDGVLRSVEFLSTYSPRYYNFETDSFRAEYTIDLDALADWLDSQDDVSTVEETMCEIFQSRDGFMSFVPGMFEREPEETNLWGALWLWFRDELDGDESMFYDVHEGADEVYRENITIHWTPALLSTISGWDEEDIQHALTQEDIDELVWSHVDYYHNQTIYGTRAA